MNPYKLILKEAKVSERQFAKTHEYARDTLIQVGNGIGEKMSDRVRTDLLALCFEKGINVQELMFRNYGVHSLEEAYQQWRKLERLQIAHKYIRKPERYPVGVSASPFLHYAIYSGGSITRMAKELKLAPATLTRYALGKVSSMPASLRSALQEIKYPWISELEQYQAEWREKR